MGPEHGFNNPEKIEYNDPEYPYDPELIRIEVARQFEVSIERAADIFKIPSGKAPSLESPARFKYEITNDSTHGRIMIITRKSDKYKLIIGEKGYNSVDQHTGEKIAIPDIVLISYGKQAEDLTAQARLPRKNRR